ncbi:LysR substrate-binding domain-containing protein [Niveispirillum sp.]|uniref:LysR substrate-binding domain-containing protein n=1 Tax=Niveispirillum sp. TaxID=1917217 RepID=UPI001B5F81E3|nr:LysR substrate-binding domain-containing protein [Niveispirillum sp.]MBP7336924.1 LysR family transcriptional regulator [Niveispirillum sp.]
MPVPQLPFDLDLLRSFVTIVEAGGVTRAAERLGRTQSTVSLQMKRLEDGLGRRLFQRDGKSFEMTAEGEQLLTYARRLLSLAGEASAALMEPEVGGAVRLGTPEDFATTHLPDILFRFARAHPQVALEVRCDFTANLLDGFAQGDFDLILCKREPQGPGDGLRVWREPLVWAASPRLLLSPEQPVPLVLAPSPDLYRRRALEALERSGIPWRIAYTSPSLAGIQAAVSAGLGITILSRDMLAAGFQVVDASLGLPDLTDMEIALHRRPGAPSKAVDLLASHIVRSLEQSPAARLGGH